MAYGRSARAIARASELVAELRGELPDRVLEDFDLAVSRAATARDAEDAISTMGHGDRPRLVRLLLQIGARKSVLRAALAHCWSMDHRRLLEVFPEDYLIHAFAAAGFRPPRGTPENVTLWRGTSGVEAGRAAEGLSWTTDRSTACWFAMFYRPRGEPMVMRAVVPSAEVAMFQRDRGENEAVVFEAASFDPSVDGTPAEWLEKAAAYESAKQEANRRRQAGRGR